MRLMMQNGITVPLFDDPNKLDLHSVAESVQLIKDGMKLTEQVIKGEAVFDFDTNSMSQEEKNKFAEICSVFVQNPSSEKLQEYQDKFYEFKLENLQTELWQNLQEVIEALYKFAREKFPTIEILDAAEGDIFYSQLFALVDVQRQLEISRSGEAIRMTIDQALEKLPRDWDMPKERQPHENFHDVLTGIKLAMESIESVHQEITASKEKKAANLSRRPNP